MTGMTALTKLIHASGTQFRELMPTSQSIAFMAKLNPSGAFQWIMTVGSGNNNLGRSVAVDSQDNIILAGVSIGILRHT